MLRFLFDGGFADVKFSDIPKCIFQNGFCCDARWNGRKYSAYVVLNRKGWTEPSYIDLDDEFDENVLHASLTGVELLVSDKAFVHAFCGNAHRNEKTALDNLKKELYLKSVLMSTTHQLKTNGLVTLQ